MLVITQSSFVCPRIKLCVEKSKAISLFGTNSNYNNHENKCINLKRNINVLHNGYSYFTSPYHPLQSELPKQLEEDDDNIAGIGILKFFHGKNIFITGATGLLGKVLVEKILRSTDVGKIYVLIKAKDKDSAFDRLTKEIINSELLSCLKEKHGKYYETFVKEKLIPIVGNICEPNLGMDSHSAYAIKKDVHVIIQSAASTTLNDRYDLLLEANMNAPQRLMSVVNLIKFDFVAYVNGRREGTILEKPLIMGHNRRKDNDDDDDNNNDEIVSSFARLDVTDELNMALKASTAFSNSDDYDLTKNLKRLAQDRATLYGWYNPYHMTKAMGEMVLNEIRGDVPLLIIRPTVIESSCKDPFPGWIQGNRMFDPVIISYGKGQLPAFICDPNKHVDIIPVDMVANTTIAAVAKHGAINEPQLNVYHVASSALNPLKYSDFFEFLYDYFNSTPLNPSENNNNNNNISKIKCFDNFYDFSKYTRQEICRRNGLGYKVTVGSDDEKIIRKLQSQCKAKVAYAEQLCKMYEFIGLFNARFHTGNTQKLLEEMSKEEQLDFEVDVMNIQWRKYFQEIHIPGLRKHLLNTPTTGRTSSAV
ncbi:hypothetical protein BUALT_Bualt09G0002300 [Buddleja alternifolia]|uniref:Fatty acyl-CoA reductase n=1 Tax=Buddleja alternifolia TaxID=168488 RepID=A0AAV6WZW4_9LAMI|nr:hypothetical protein BUALT_Bualt09G0002300 [Buddleja alternifolia]